MNYNRKKIIISSLLLFFIVSSFMVSGYRYKNNSIKKKKVYEPIVDFTVQDVSLEDALTMLGNKYHISIVTKELFPGRVTCSFQNMKLTEAILTLIGESDYYVTRNLNIYKITKKSEKIANNKIKTNKKIKTDKKIVSNIVDTRKKIKKAEDNLLIRVETAIKGGNLEKAKNIIKLHLKKYPDSLLGYALLGNIYKEEKRLLSARQAWINILKISPDNKKVKESVAQIDKIIKFIREKNRSGLKSPKLNLYLR